MSLFGSEPEKTPYEELYDKLHEKAVVVLNDTIDKITPDIEERLKGGIDFLIENADKPELSWETFENFIHALGEESDSGHDEVEEFSNKLLKSKLFVEISKNQDLRCLVMGRTGVGKSSTIKILFSIPQEKLSVGDGTSSSTSDVTEYKISVNGCNLIFADTPGLYDTRGKETDDENMEKILRYVKETKDIHIFFLFFKIGDMVDLSHKTLISRFEEVLGKDVWDRTIIILTHANECPPEEYFYKGFYDPFEDIPDFSDKEAWSRHFKAKSEMWKKAFDADIPVVPIENNTQNCQRKCGDLLLGDGTPMWENLITVLLMKISKAKAPILFNLVSGKVSDELKGKEPKEKVNSSHPTPKSKPTITNKQRIVNKAANNAQEEIDGWFCTLY